jgi:hypothetical protein
MKLNFSFCLSVSSRKLSDGCTKDTTNTVLNTIAKLLMNKFIAIMIISIIHQKSIQSI